jgi:SAM-dependent methyltransferase
VRGAGTPEGWTVLDDWEVLPASLVAVEGASVLVVLDPLSFPFEGLTGALRDVPLLVVLPEEADADFLAAVFGGPVFGRLDFFDRLATADMAVWEDLRRRYRLAGGQLVRLGEARPEAAAGEIAAFLLDEAREDGATPGAPRRAARGAYPEKAAHRAQRAALGPQFAAAHGGRAEDVPFRVLEVGAGDGRRVASFDPAGAEFYGLDADEENVLAARAEWPEAWFGHLGTDLRFPHKDEMFDLVFSVGVMGRYPEPEKRRLLSEMWRVARPGGRLLFLEDFVATGEGAKSGARPSHVVSVNKFVELLLVATGWQVVMEHVESLRYPDEVLTRGGLIAVSRLGVPKRW